MSEAIVLDETRGITFADGFRASAVRAGLKQEGDDLALIVSDQPASVAGAFTSNVVKASCVRRNARVVLGGSAHAIVCNAGNANCCNGVQGDRDDERLAELVASQLGIRPELVLTASTGIIGKPMPMDKFEAAIPETASVLSRSVETDLKVARAIMTTDTRPKQVGIAFEVPSVNGTVRIGGVCKGSGMIAPRMGPPHATMLCFLTTDGSISPGPLQEALNSVVHRTFNRMTVDGDTSTNDMVLLLANGASSVDVSGGATFDAFQSALEDVCLYLAKEVARDGEGATKLVQVVVRGAATECDAERVARTIAESPLVKTALFGKDPNWGRLLMAAGRAGVPFDLNVVEAKLGEFTVFHNGTGIEFDERAASAYLADDEVKVELNLNTGNDEATCWTCDYSYDYVRINADYHT